MGLDSVRMINVVSLRVTLDIVLSWPTQLSPSQVEALDMKERGVGARLDILPVNWDLGMLDRTSMDVEQVSQARASARGGGLE